MLTGSEVPDQKSVIRFRLTMSLSALPRSSLEEERPKALETEDRVTWIGALALSEPEQEEILCMHVFQRGRSLGIFVFIH